jgi:WD40 repeat protein
LTLQHTYLPEVGTVVEFAGASYFGGQNDGLVLSASKSGDIYVWDTGSGTLLLHLPAAPRRGELTCIAWNHAVDDPFMLATGYHDGTVIIWTKPKDNPESKMEVSTIINAGRDMNSGNLSTIMNYCDSRRFEFFMEHAQFHQFPAPTQEQTHEDN